MKNQKNTHKEEITRNEAMKKMGKYAALTALGTFIMLNPKKAQAGSFDPGTGFKPWGD